MNKKFIPVALVLVLVLAGLALWFGLRGSALGPGGDTDITLFAPEGTEVIVLESTEAVEEGETTESEPVLHTVDGSGELELDLENGDYEILANIGDEYYPWVKNVRVTGLLSTELRPFFLPRESTLEPVDDEEIASAFATPATLPTSENPRVNADESAELYVSSGVAYVNWTGEVENMPEYFCPGENVVDCTLQPIYNFGPTVENVEFYGENDELLIADLGTAVIAVEIDRRATQNAQPVYMGSAPVAFRIIDGEVYVSEGGVVSRVELN